MPVASGGWSSAHKSMCEHRGAPSCTSWARVTTRTRVERPPFCHDHKSLIRFEPTTSGHLPYARFLPTKHNGDMLRGDVQLSLATSALPAVSFCPWKQIYRNLNHKIHTAPHDAQDLPWLTAYAADRQIMMLPMDGRRRIRISTRRERPAGSEISIKSATMLRQWWTGGSCMPVCLEEP